MFHRGHGCLNESDGRIQFSIIKYFFNESSVIFPFSCSIFVSCEWLLNFSFDEPAKDCRMIDWTFVNKNLAGVRAELAVRIRFSSGEYVETGPIIFGNPWSAVLGETVAQNSGCNYQE